MGKKTELSWHDGLTLGLHLTINGPKTPLPASARIYQRFLQNGLRLDTDQLNALLAGRELAILTINNALHIQAPDHGPLHGPLAPMIVDALLDKSLDSQLSREAPTALDRIAQRDQVLSAAFGGVPTSGSPLDQVLSAVKLGASLTIHF
jgi:hypothetical protein